MKPCGVLGLHPVALESWAWLGKQTLTILRHQNGVISDIRLTRRSGAALAWFLCHLSGRPVIYQYQRVPLFLSLWLGENHSDPNQGNDDNKERF